MTHQNYFNSLIQHIFCLLVITWIVIGWGGGSVPFFPGSPAWAASPTIIGDINNDGQANLADVIVMLQVQSGLTFPNINIQIADINNTGISCSRIDITDAMLLMQRCAGLPNRGIPPSLSNLVFTITPGQKEVLKNSDFSPCIHQYSLPEVRSPEMFITATSRHPSHRIHVQVRGIDTQIASGVPFSIGSPLKKDQKIEITVLGETGETMDYEVFGLPADFPRISVTAFSPEAFTSEGYLFLSNFNSPEDTGMDTSVGKYLLILNNYAVPKWYDGDPLVALDFKVQAGGSLTYFTQDMAFQGFGMGFGNQRFVEMDKGFNQVATHSCKQTIPGLTIITDEHECLLLQNGNVLMLGRSPIIEDMQAYGGKADAEIQDMVIQEIDPSGNVVFNWQTREYLNWPEELPESSYDYL